VAELTVKTWKRFGKHRLYVNARSGESIGWVDVESNCAVLTQQELRKEFELTLEAHGIRPQSIECGRPGSLSVSTAVEGEIFPPDLTPQPLAVPDVRGHEKVPGYGHLRSPLVATKVPAFGHEKSPPLTEVST